MDVLQWIDEVLHPKTCDSGEFIYDDMDSQSGRSLPIIYEPFDARDESHWRDRGSLYDFLCSLDGEGKRLLDFGPGDGWPALLVAPFAAEVVGVEGSRRRAATCNENAERLGIPNAKFVFVAPGAPLPFNDESFEGVTAASSVEQTPDPLATLGELFRILRPGGRLRIKYESLAEYQNGQERDIWLWGIDKERCKLILFDRDISRERVRQYGLTFAIPARELAKAFSGDVDSLSFSMITMPRLEAAVSRLIDARVCVTRHPAGETLAGGMRNLGFSQVNPTHGGSEAAGRLFNEIPEKDRPVDLRGVDELVRPVAKIVCKLSAPMSTNPMITAVK